jgi:hypothetical protein
MCTGLMCLITALNPAPCPVLPHVALTIPRRPRPCHRPTHQM